MNVQVRLVDWFVPITFVVAFLASIITGIGGAGGGFIATPYYLFIGLSPAQSLATSKMAILGASVGAVTAFKGKGLVHKGIVFTLMVITAASALLAAWLVPQIDASLFENAVGLILIAMVPTLFIKKAAFQKGHRARRWIIVGYVLYGIFCVLSGVLATGIGTLLVIILMYFFGLSALEANATKRISQTVQAVLITVLLALQGFIVWAHGIAAVLGATIGSYIGSHWAIKKGSGFVKVFMAVIMLVSGVVLLVV